MGRMSLQHGVSTSEVFVSAQVSGHLARLIRGTWPHTHEQSQDKQMGTYSVRHPPPPHAHAPPPSQYPTPPAHTPAHSLTYLSPAEVGRVDGMVRRISSAETDRRSPPWMGVARTSAPPTLPFASRSARRMSIRCSSSVLPAISSTKSRNRAVSPTAVGELLGIPASNAVLLAAEFDGIELRLLWSRRLLELAVGFENREEASSWHLPADTSVSGMCSASRACRPVPAMIMALTKRR